MGRRLVGLLGSCCREQRATTITASISCPITDFLQQTESEVFRGTVTACSEHGLVLDAKGITYRLVAMGGEAALLVFPADAAAAVEELARYAAERSVRTEPVPGFIPFEGGITGALVYVAVLITVAYCAGRQTFDADWLTLGALDSSVGRAGQW